MKKATQPALPRAKRSGDTDADRERSGPELARGRWDSLARRGLFETVIVAVGVFLALMVDEWREGSEQRELAEEARAALREEILANREAIFERLGLTANLYVLSESQPGQVGRFVFERRNRQLLINDAAWTMTIETGAIRWLQPSERRDISEIYAGHARMRDVVSQEMSRWTELAEFEAVSGPRDERRDRAIRVWRGFAQRVQLALCINLARHEIALGGRFPSGELMRSCAARQPEEDPKVTYAKWQARGWLSPVAPRSLDPASAR